MQSTGLTFNSRLITVILPIFLIILIILMVILLRNKYKYYTLQVQNNNLLNINKINADKIDNLNANINNLQKVSDADRKIFNYLRCLNVPRATKCKKISTYNTICRSQQLDCNKYKLEIEADDITNKRLIEITKF